MITGVGSGLLALAAALPQAAMLVPDEGSTEERVVELRAQVASEPDPAAKASLLIELGHVQQDFERHAEALECFARVVELSRELDDDVLRLVGLGNTANSLLCLGELREAAEVGTEALEIARESEDGDQIWRLANTVGSVYLRLAEYSAALGAFELALEHCPLDDPAGRSVLYTNFAVANIHAGDRELAERLLDAALPYFELVGDEFRMAAVHANRADLLVLEGNYEEALPLHEQALRMRQAAGEEGAVASSLTGMGRSLFGIGEHERARAVLEEAREIQERLGLQVDLAITLGCLSEVYLHLGRDEEAHGTALRGIELAEQVEALGLRVEALHSLIEIFEARGDLERALELHEEAHAQLVALRPKQVQREFARIQSQLAIQEANHRRFVERKALEAHVTRVLLVSGAALLVAAGFGWFLFLGKRRAVGRLEAAMEEIRELEEERIRTAKLESLGVLAGGIAHDFNNVLTAVRGNVSMLREKLDDRTDVGTELGDAEAAIGQASRLARQLLALSKGGAPVREPCDLATLVRDAASITAAGSHVAVHYELPEGLWPAEVDAGQISQLVSIAVLNAIQAMPTRGRITIGGRNRAARPGAGATVRIWIDDTGPGIPRELRDRVFDPYFTTKPPSSGMGLTTAHAIVRRHGGTLRLESPPGVGTRFQFELPATPGLLRPVAPPAETERTDGGRVLVVDDEPLVRRLYERLLDRLGYAAVLVADGESAVAEYARARASGRPFDVAVLDLTLPGGIGGQEVLDRIRELDPDARAIVASGYSDSAVLADPAAAGFAGKLAKPFDLAALSGALAAVLDRRRPVGAAERPGPDHGGRAGRRGRQRTGPGSGPGPGPRWPRRT